MTEFETYLHAVLMRAEHEAREDGSKTIEAQHMLLAIAAVGAPATQCVLDTAGLDHETIRGALEREFEHSLSVVGVSARSYDLPAPSRGPSHPKMGASAKLVMERGVFGAARKKDLRPAHLLLGVLRAEAGTVPRALALAGVDKADLVARTQEELR
jgi:ATP-dependent Clp protease ATP-binding subunit ClpA